MGKYKINIYVWESGSWKWGGSGVWDTRYPRIDDCPAVLDDDPEVCEEIYSDLERGIEQLIPSGQGETEVVSHGRTYTVYIEEVE